MRTTLLLTYFLLSVQPLAAQLSGFQVPAGKEKVEIPFRFENNFILIDVMFNKIFPLTFIFDTGSENTVLTHKTFADLLDVDYERNYKIMGADLQQELLVHLARGVQLDLATVPSNKVPLLVLEENYFQFEKYTGIKIQGILGMDLFKLVVIQIDYKRKKLVLYRPDNFKIDDTKFKKYPIDVYRGKAYLTVDGTITRSDTIPLKLLIDSGANIALLLHNDSDSSITLPPKLIPGKLGDGLGGYIEGYMGRTYRLHIDPFEFSNITTHFQEVPVTLDSLNLNNRNGILGNEILSRFNVILVPYKNELYLKPERKYNRKFNYDKSGITLIASGLGLNQFTVVSIIPNSPAAEAGLQVGDEVLSVNFLPTRFYGLNDLLWKFQKRSGKQFRLKVLRDGKELIIRFRLRELI